MILRKLKNIKTRMFKPKKLKEMPPVAQDPKVLAGIADYANTNVDSSSLAGVKFLKQRLNASQKQYFDSADHFIRLHEMQAQLSQDVPQLSDPAPAQEITTAAQEMASVAEEMATVTGDAGEVANAPLETAFSEIVEEMKPKESV
ncbi:hypothetical protein NEDG_01909 [Nematocida displodere]|uniref:Uncharacterized protein n=1 Tax=Nematocida displodere TaxID=1805483 RepID=A0A177EGP1_9MICR|nr:hypothetical protein NEDG_01909 [Nematocida displodere]